VLDVKQKATRSDYGAFPSPATGKNVVCPCCQSQAVTGLYLVPLSFRDLERSIDLRKQCAAAAAKTSATQLGKHPRDGDNEMYAESSYMLLSHSRGGSLSGNGLSDREQQRTGRWTDEEIEFVDFLVNAFDQGVLPLPHGIKLNEFLGDMLLCKSSRLTKKMKNAKLSTRSFSLLTPSGHGTGQNCTTLSNLQEKFLKSVQSEPTQLELRFNISKQWRTHFSNLCLQVGYTNLDGTDWIASLDEMEHRASKAEEAIRKVRRRRMGLALRTDGGSSANPSVFIGGLPADNAHNQLQPVLSADLGLEPNRIKEQVSLPKSPALGPLDMMNTRSPVLSGRAADFEDVDEYFMMSSMMDLGGSSGNQRPRGLSEDFSVSSRPRSFSEDFNAVLSDLMEPPSAQVPALAASFPRTPSPSSNTCGPFLDAIIHLMEEKQLPFEHVDVWVPSFLPRDGSEGNHELDTEQLRLFHAGYATRGDVGDEVGFRWNEFGVYSSSFSFEPGHGLPGRVYACGKAMWDCDVDLQDPKYFERAGGAKVYSVKTAVGIPLNTSLVGRIIVAMYSSQSLPEDRAMIHECEAELANYSPEPKWKLVIEMNDPPGTENRNSYSSSPRTSSAAPTKVAAFLGLNALPPQAGSAVSTSQGDNLEQRIVQLLGDNMPVTDESPAGESTSSINTAKFLPHFMSIRLLLLRPASRRSSQENEMIDILKESFRAYCNDNKRSGAELATLLAKDWICLKASFPGVAAMGNSPPPRPMAPAAAAKPGIAATNSTNQFQQRMSIPGQDDVHRSHAMMPVLAPTSGFPAPMAAMNHQTNQFNAAPPPNPGMGMFSFDSMQGATKRHSLPPISTNGDGMSGSMGGGMNPPPNSIRRGSSVASNTYRSESFDITPGNRSHRGSFDESSSLAGSRNSSIQPHIVKSSSQSITPDGHPQPMPPQPNVVLEH
jgi:hypothetical protein